MGPRPIFFQAYKRLTFGPSLGPTMAHFSAHDLPQSRPIQDLTRPILARPKHPNSARTQQHQPNSVCSSLTSTHPTNAKQRVFFTVHPSGFFASLHASFLLFIFYMPLTLPSAPIQLAPLDQQCLFSSLPCLAGRPALVSTDPSATPALFPQARHLSRHAFRTCTDPLCNQARQLLPEITLTQLLYANSSLEPSKAIAPHQGCHLFLFQRAHKRQKPARHLPCHLSSRFLLSIMASWLSPLAKENHFGSPLRRGKRQTEEDYKRKKNPRYRGFGRGSKNGQKEKEESKHRGESCFFVFFL